ncbi:GIY-YIG nuclease family protein [Patescibacteria group bacterium]|nr:GIY-YIG nuclease family protein [Patescibacteria group bacterium]
MAFWVYILRSQSTERYYCGQADDVEKRLQQHNDPDMT